MRVPSKVVYGIIALIIIKAKKHQKYITEICHMMF